MGKHNNTESRLLDYPQSNIQIELPTDKEWRDERKSKKSMDERKSKKSMDVEESVVLETFRQAPSMYE
jgi:hypothetical protein